MDQPEMNRHKEAMRIALVIPHLAGGGAERSVLKLARGLIERGHVVDILFFKKIDTLADEVPAGARQFLLKQQRTSWFHDRKHLVRRFGFRLFRFLRGDLLRDARSIAAYIDKERPDCILPSLPRAKVATMSAVSFTKLNPVIVPIMHSVVMNRRRRYRNLYSILFATADHVVAVSDGVADNVALVLGISRKRISRVYNPVVDSEIAELARAAPAHPWMMDNGCPIILSVGRLARVKDFPTLLRAFRNVSQNRQVRLIILGDGSWRPRLEYMVRKMGLETKVSLPGWVSNPYAFMSRASMLVLSSKFEGLANVLIEALACGCPCVSTNCPSGPNEILGNGKFGPLVPVGNVPELATAMEHVLDFPLKKDMLLGRANEFSVDNSIDSYERIIVDLVRKRRHRHSACIQNMGPNISD